jgi:hypothetical protein
MRDKQIAIRSIEKVIDTINTLSNTAASSAKIIQIDLSASTLTGIKKYHRFEANQKRNIVYAYFDSTRTKQDKTYHPRDIVTIFVNMPN